MRGDLPTGTVTFLFTDIEGSTRLLHALGPDAYAEALAEHRRVLREAFTAHGGVEVDTQGDAFFVAFPTAQGAAAAARQGAVALAPGPISVRMGLHTGTATVAAEGYVGVDVHRGARVGALAHGGQIVLSPATAALLEEEPLRDLGTHRLKDFDGAVRLFQLGLDPFPALRTPGSVELPAPATRFLGRERELFQAVSRVHEDDPRVLTVLGPGGTGKTRFTIELCRLLADEAEGGTVFCALAPLREPGLVLATIAEHLGASSPEPGAIAARIGEACFYHLDAPVQRYVPAFPQKQWPVTTRQLAAHTGGIRHYTNADFSGPLACAPDLLVSELCGCLYEACFSPWGLGCPEVCLPVLVRCTRDDMGLYGKQGENVGEWHDICPSRGTEASHGGNYGMDKSHILWSLSIFHQYLA